MKRVIFISVCIIFYGFTSAQTDTILVYDIATQSTGTIFPVSFDTTIIAENTPAFVGSMGNKVSLSLVPPTTNLFSNANFSDLALASSFFNLTDYPIRTAVSLRNYKNDTLRAGCSGMIVAPCFVLTSATCVFDLYFKNFSFFDSIKVFPAYNNGQAQPALPASMVKRIYLFKSFYSQTKWDDVALLELRNPIGLQTGWTGIGFNSAPGFTNGKVFHKFSYPGVISPFDSTKIYNGDTLYYNYGYINDLGPWYGVVSNDAQGIPGQGGSMYMYTDNNTDYYSIGLFSFSSNYAHYKLTNKAFYQLKNVMKMLICSSGTAGLKENEGESIGLKLYPNPLNREATLDFKYDPAKQYSLKIVNALGQQLRSMPVNGGHIVIPRENMEVGIYFVRLSADNSTYTCKMMVE